MEKETQNIEPRHPKPRLDKLFDATDLEGNKNEDVFQIARRVEAECSKIPSFIGVVPFGSKTKGYSAEGSDVDLYVLYENSDRDMRDMMNKLEAEFEKEGLAVELLDWSVTEHALPFVAGKPVEPGVALLGEPDAPDSLAMLSGAGIGPKLDLYRASVREAIQKWPKERKEALFSLVLKNCMEGERGSIEKIKERMPDFNENEYLSVRESLWKHRLEKLFFA